MSASNNSSSIKIRRGIAIVVILLAIILLTASNLYFAVNHVGNDIQKSVLFDALQTSLGIQTTLENESRDSSTGNISDSYLLSSICGGCTRSRINKNTCFALVLKEQEKLGRNTSLVAAASKVGMQHKECELCDPEKCSDHYHIDRSTKSKYWRFDRSSPKFSNPTTLYLKSIPSELRIPPSRFEQIAVYFQEMHNYTFKNNLTGMPYLLEYNPGLVVIPPAEKAKLPSEAYYLLSLRVTPANNCFHAQVYADLPTDVWKSVYMTGINHLGLALLDKNFQIMEGYETVIEMDVQLDLRRKTFVGSTLSPTFMDYRLFVLNGHVYLHANAETVVVTQLNLSTKERDDHDEILYCDFIYEIGKKIPPEVMDKPCRMKSLFGGKLEVAIHSQFRTIWSGGKYGKNYALFSIPNSTHPDAPDTVYAEIDIFPHHVHQILPNENNQISRHQVFERIWKPGTRKSRNYPIDIVNEREMKTVGIITESRREVPLPSFFNVDAHQDWFPGKDAPFKEAVHGGACCVSFSKDELNLGGRNYTGESMLLVGIGHTKVTFKLWYGRDHIPQREKDRVPHTHYVSLFYAFDPFPPFEIRARSGYFCFGHVPLTGDKEFLPTEGGSFNPHSVLTRNRNLSQNFVTFDCPQMHFVSSFIEKAGDSSKTVVGYGLNDCTGRLIEVDKREIVRQLYPEPMDMVFEDSDEA